MSELLERCRAYGADVDATMERFVDDEALFEQCLEAFTEDVGFDGLKSSIKEQNYKQAFEHAHALKGVAGNLGLSPLFHAISDLVESFRANDYSKVDCQYVKILEEREKVKDLLK